MKKLVLGLLLLWASCTQVVAQLADDTGVDYTPAELELWIDRANNGPYKNKGTNGTNSPGDWERIVINASNFSANPTKDYYRIQVPTADSPVTCVKQTTVPLSPEGKYRDLRDAAYYYLIKKNAGGAEQATALAYAAKVYTAIKKQMNDRRDNNNPSSLRLFDFDNTARWCEDEQQDQPPSYYMAAMMERIRKAYEYTKTYSGYSTADHAAIRTWFLGAARYFMDRNVNYYYRSVFNGRLSGNYTNTSGRAELLQYSTKPADQLYYGSTRLVNLSRSYNNRFGQQVMFAANVGLMYNDAPLKASAKLYVYEYLRFSCYPLGLVNGKPFCLPAELHRGSDAAPEQGWQYAFDCINQLISIADGFARQGDTSVYAMTTSEGVLSLAGGEKSIKALIYGFMLLQDGTVKRYCTLQSNREGNALYRLDGYDPINNRSYVGDSWFAPAMRYYITKDKVFAQKANSIYLRKALGLNPWPSTPSGSGSSNGWTGSFGAGAPGYLFMYGDTEDKPSNNYLPNFPSRYNVNLYHLESTNVSSKYLGYDGSKAANGDSIKLASRWVSQRTNTTDSLIFNYSVAVRVDSIIDITGIPAVSESGIVTRFSPDRNIVWYYYSGGTWTEAFHRYNNLLGKIEVAVNIPSCTKLMRKSLKPGGYYSWTRELAYIRGAAVTP